MREGEYATFVGSAGDGLAVGDRCLVLSIEGRYSSIKWVTGDRLGNFGTVMNNDIAADRRTRVSAFDCDDEFGFEVEMPKSVRVATGAVHECGGDVALLRALDADGMLFEAREAARETVTALYETVNADPRWREVVSELGESGPGFLAYAMRGLIIEAMKEERDVSGA